MIINTHEKYCFVSLADDLYDLLATIEVKEPIVLMMNEERPRHRVRLVSAAFDTLTEEYDCMAYEEYSLAYSLCANTIQYRIY